MKSFIYAIIILVAISFGFYFLSNVFNDESIQELDFENEGLDFSFGEEKEGDSSSRQAGTQNDIGEFGKELRAEILREGTGQELKNRDKAEVHYVGVLEDGTKFDSSLDRGQPFVLTVGAGQVIQGWELGLIGMKVGEIRKLYIPWEYAYGEAGAGSMIPPKANLIFEVELLKIY